MPRRCTICGSSHRDDIDRVLVEGRTPYRRIATQFRVSESSVRRHAAGHLPQALATAADAAQAANGDDLLFQVRQLQERAVTILDRAETDGDHRVALAAIREARGCLELLGRLAGELQERQSVNVLIDPRWVEIRGLILHALEPHKEAREAVTSALGTVVNGGI
jgi:hypothetical protein